MNSDHSVIALERLDVVDEMDQVVGQTDISVANVDPKIIHREVGIFIFDDQNRALVQKRGLAKRQNPGVWTVAAAGHVSSGQSYEEAAHKELLEELGFDTKLVFVRKLLNHQKNETRFSSLYMGKYRGEQIVLQENEVDQIMFISPEGLEEFVKSNQLSKMSNATVLDFWEGKFDEFKKQL